MKEEDWEIYRSIELEWIKDEVWNELEKELIQEYKDEQHRLNPSFKISFFQCVVICSVLLVFAFGYLYMSFLNPQLLITIIDLPILKPIILVLPSAIFGLLAKRRQKKVTQN